MKTEVRSSDFSSNSRSDSELEWELESELKWEKSGKKHYHGQCIVIYYDVC